MIEIISGSDRPGSNSLKVSQWLARRYAAAGAAVHVIDLAQFDLGDANGGRYKDGPRGTFKDGVERVNAASGLVMVVPEYNGSYPGVLKLFIDYWSYPRSFERRAVAMIGLGYRWGGLRPVEHLQQVFGYRNAYVFPNRVFLPNVPSLLTNDEVSDSAVAELLDIQTRDFLKFVRALASEGLNA